MDETNYYLNNRCPTFYYDASPSELRFFNNKINNTIRLFYKKLRSLGPDTIISHQAVVDDTLGLTVGELCLYIIHRDLNKKKKL